MKEVRFNIFRYQIIPTTQIQLSLFDAPITVDELKARKNEFFFDTLLHIEEFRHSRAELIFQIDSPSKDIIVLRLGASRGLKEKLVNLKKKLLITFHQQQLFLTIIQNLKKWRLKSNTKHLEAQPLLLKF